LFQRSAKQLPSKIIADPYEHFPNKLMKRFAYFTADGKLSGPSYHQAYIFRGVIENHGVSFDYFPLLPDSIWHHWKNALKKRGIGGVFMRKLIRGLVIPLWRMMQIFWASLRNYDGYIVGRCLSQSHSFPWLEVILSKIGRLQKKPLILYLADAMHIPFPAQYDMRFACFSHVAAVTPWLVDQMRLRGLRCFLTRVAIDVRRYPMIEHSARERLVIGFSSGPDNFRELLDLEDALIEILRRYPHCRLQIVSGVPPHFKSEALRYEFKPWLHDNPFGRFDLGVEEMLEFDIALAPLLRNDYALGKDSAKLRQYMALGLPVAATDFGVNAEMIEDGVSGYLATDIPQWIGVLSKLIEDAGLRTKMGRAARTRVEAKFDVHPQAVLLARNLISCTEGK
jgi:glycosyltransferase involved in cell wall biosynthesis